MRKTLGSSLALCLTCVVALETAIAPAMFTAAQAQDPAPMAVASQTQLEKLLAPIALYSDPLLAQVLLAATFPDQITEAAEYVRSHGTADIDDQSWDVSVKAIAHYPTILNMMDAKPEWTAELGQAYASQSSDVMGAVQRLRAQANAQGNLTTTAQQQVVVEPSYIAIWPANPRVIYVPVYDPFAIYVRHVGFYGRYPGAFVFGIGFPIGPWLIYDWDWPGRRIYYTGWNGGGWIGRSRPFIHVTNIYVNDRYRSVGGYERVHYTNPGRYVDRHRDAPENWARGRDNFNRGNEARSNRNPSHAYPTNTRGREEPSRSHSENFPNSNPGGEHRSQPADEGRGQRRSQPTPSGEQTTTHQARPESHRERFVPTPQPRATPAPAPQQQPSGGRQGGGNGGGGNGGGGGGGGGERQGGGTHQAGGSSGHQGGAVQSSNGGGRSGGHSGRRN